MKYFLLQNLGLIFSTKKKINYAYKTLNTYANKIQAFISIKLRAQHDQVLYFFRRIISRVLRVELKPTGADQKQNHALLFFQMWQIARDQLIQNDRIRIHV